MELGISMRCIITGASGLLGSYLFKTSPTPMVLPARFDITDREAVAEAFKRAGPVDLVIHCAAEGRTDIAELDYNEAWTVNVRGTANLMAEAIPMGCHFVHISTNAVYDGDRPPYKELTPRFPINAYGRIKNEAEMLFAGYPNRKTLIRPIMLYGYGGRRDNMVTRLLRDLQTQDLKSFGQIPVAEDIMSQPTYALDCALAIWKIIQHQIENKVHKQVVNVAPKEKISLFKFAVEVAKAWELDPDLIVPVKAETLPYPAKRPRDTTYDTSHLESLGIVLRGVEEGLRAMKAEQR